MIGHGGDPWATLHLLSMAARLVERRWDNALAGLGLTHAAVLALRGIAAGPLNQERLAAAVRIQAQTLGRVLTRLEQDGLVTRVRAPGNRRSINVTITDAGRSALDRAHQAERNILPADMEQASALHRELRRIVSAFPSSGENGAGNRRPT